MVSVPPSVLRISLQYDSCFYLVFLLLRENTVVPVTATPLTKKRAIKRFNVLLSPVLGESEFSGFVVLSDLVDSFGVVGLFWLVESLGVVGSVAVPVAEISTAVFL